MDLLNILYALVCAVVGLWVKLLAAEFRDMIPTAAHWIVDKAIERLPANASLTISRGASRARQ
ncbi:MAG TPA: hypothetical protein VKX28_04805 [Xanthobacteraceae bacterium]|nr:hypothetical protein [Xanthobacteraceae bacterium]